MIYSTWQDAQHVRGTLRRTTVKNYADATPNWETVLDYDALAKADNQSWVHKGMDCLSPASELCMVALSVGGEDAVTTREFNLKASKFVEGGFVLPRGKQAAAWLDKDTLLLSRDWRPATMSEAGYPITVRVWKRGEPLEKSREVFKGDVKDNGYGNNPVVFRDAQGHLATLIVRSLSMADCLWESSLPSILRCGRRSSSRFRCSICLASSTCQPTLRGWVNTALHLCLTSVRSWRRSRRTTSCSQV